jgi:hypothetical protein
MGRRGLSSTMELLRTTGAITAGKSQVFSDDLARRVWWRRRELNPRPRKPEVQSLRVYPVLAFQRLPKEPAKARAA